MKILVGKCFGIGNAIMTIPMLRAIAFSARHMYMMEEFQLDVLVGNTSDDGGAYDVFQSFKELGHIDNLWIGKSPEKYDLAIMSIPYDGRWQNGVHFSAKEVIDGRTRPDPSTTGLVSWKKHEIEYQMDTAVERFHWTGPVPPLTFMNPLPFFDNILPNSIYLGLGYKKDVAGFWKVKHWGNANYAELVRRLLADDPSLQIYTSGDTGDLQYSINPIMSMVKNDRFHFVPTVGLRQAFELVGRCEMYVGNDTGMMHVAASYDKPVCALFFLENSVTKARPWCTNYSCIEAYDPPRTLSVDEVMEEVKDVRACLQK